MLETMEEVEKKTCHVTIGHTRLSSVCYCRPPNPYDELHTGTANATADLPSHRVCLRQSAHSEPRKLSLSAQALLAWQRGCV